MILTSGPESTLPIDCGVMRMNCLPTDFLAALTYPDYEPCDRSKGLKSYH